MTVPSYSEIFARHEAKKQAWAEAGEQALLDQMHDAYRGLRHLGWRDGRYAPRDGTRFLAIQDGSTGMFPCYWAPNEHVDGGLFMLEDGDIYPQSAPPVLWKPIKDTP